ncbi:MAG TPA: lysophospholipid acyltransferase family protein [Candidatus Binatia bacterium]|nr:lysophospholipid acyltransferase family protein [Candidatus Binatia bacterium]
MEGPGLRAALRFDGAAWRRFAELGCVYGPEWWKRGSPPVIAGIIYAIARAQRTAVLANQRQVRGARGWARERWDAYRVFAEFARSVTEGFEQWGPRPRPLEMRVRGEHIVEEALAEHRGAVMLTGHFGSWEVAARVLSKLGRPVNMVTAHEPNPTVREFMHAVRTRHGFKVIYSDRSVFTGLPILQALRRDEIVGMQIEPWGPLPGSHPVEFCGRTTRFQLGPFAVARVARAPIVPVFAVRTGIRRYDIRIVGRFDPRTPAESVAALEATVRAYEEIVRAHPAQWLMFEPVWRPEAESVGEPTSGAAAVGSGQR